MSKDASNDAYMMTTDIFIFLRLISNGIYIYHTYLARPSTYRPLILSELSIRHAKARFHL